MINKVEASSGIFNYVKIARPDHWIKNLFIFIGVFSAIIITKSFHSTLILNSIIGLISTCLIASANYVINEWLDAEFDKYHPTKKYRPVVSSSMNSKYIYIEYALLIVMGLVLAQRISLYFFFSALSLLIMGVLYNVRPFRLKERVYLDVLSEAINNSIRLLLGWFIVTSKWLPPSSLVIGFWMSGAFLMAIKRFAEYRMIGDPKVAGLYRSSFKYYTENSILISAFFYAMCAVFFIGVFLIKYRIELLLAVPFICGLFCIYFMISFKPDSSVQKPEKLYKEKKLLLYTIGLSLLILLLFVIDIPFLHTLLSNSLVSMRLNG